VTDDGIVGNLYYFLVTFQIFI